MSITAWFILGYILGVAGLGSLINGMIALKPYISVWIRKAKAAVVRKLKNSKRFMTWLNEPTISEQIDADYIGGQITVYNSWRW